MTIVLHLDPLQGGQSICAVDSSPYALQEPHLTSIVDLAGVAGINGPDAVRQRGELMAQLLRGNQSIDQALSLALALAAGTPSMPICFRIGDAEAHALSWEGLVGNQDFLALDERWPIARIARGGNLPLGARVLFDSPLRLVTVLSAVGRKADREWEGIYGAVKEARAAGLGISVTLFAGEEDQVIAPARALGDPQIDVRPVPQTATELLNTLRTLAPHILHMFCHGTIDHSVRRLELGTITDFDDPAGTTSTVKVRMDELGTALAATETWAVVLNTCRGAETEDHNLTHAEALVSTGVPVAVGMRRLIDAADAYAFSAAFYPAAFAAIDAASKGTDRSLRWADTLIQARRELRDRHGSDAAADDAWTLPVLYTRPGGFEIVPVASGQTGEVTMALSEQEKFSEAVEALAGSAPPPGLLDDLHRLAPD